MAGFDMQRARDTSFDSQINLLHLMLCCDHQKHPLSCITMRLQQLISITSAKRNLLPKLTLTTAQRHAMHANASPLSRIHLWKR